MNMQDILASLVLLSLLANLADRVFTRRPGFFHFPRAGRLRYLFAGWSILLVALAVLSMLELVPTLWLTAAGAGWMICSQAYAIFFRHTEMKVSP